MERDASLEEFLDAGSSEDEPSPAAASTADEEPIPDEPSPAAERADESEVEPAAVTARWDPEGEPCADCGERVTRRWRDGEAFVCTDCKEW